ncbi:DUF4376 domain-containing protein [Chitinimonas sp. BJB300]|uniref:DUF4376 domain-containing protein n=1 Tax=Chitinimonas sp. BJB300 TaxID=1559339 RepID=UPI000C0CF36D|nr:DUF4376 domain-containing protein [Chitinimonas sp. BJB300]PHV11312.1 hypothetical protein CSQ89_11440 [Chitinimonas sp. BJB300]TSJ88205.1 DUF4376 domain-containing protein [Chitinimonas sp. BJB300]
MTLFYSPKERGFFDDTMHDPLPDDAQPITPTLHTELLQAQSNGAEIVPSPTGQPMARMPELTAPQLRSQLHQALNHERLRREDEGFCYQGKTIDADPASMGRITSAVMAAMAAKSLGQPFVTSWTCADNSELELDAVGMMGMAVALAERNEALHAHCRARKAEVDALDLKALKAFVPAAGWPD